MTPTAPCPGCRAALPAPPQFAGQAVRCAACGTTFTLPPVVVAAVAVPAVARPVHQERDEELDDRPARRAEPRKAFPVWLVVALGVFLVVLVGGVAGTAYLLSKRSATAGGLLDDGWVRVAPPGTDVSWEFPNETPLSLMGPGGLAMGGGEDVYPCEAPQPGGGSVILLVTITRHAAHDKQFPGQTIHDHAQKARPREGDGFNQHLRKYDIQGRTANLLRQKVAEKVVLLVTEPGATYRFEAFGPGVDESHPVVKRFVGSVKFGEAGR